MESAHPSARATTDHRVLADSAYRDDRDLGARQRLYDYQRPVFDLPGLALDRLADRGGVWADVGCGNGRYLHRVRTDRPDVRAVGLDVSASLLGALQAPVVCADAARLPLGERSVDAVLAMHMLYHLPDPARGIAEFARVLGPGGRVVASTNSRADKHEIDRLWSAAAGTVLGTGRGPRRIKLSEHFPLEDAGEAFGAHFARVRVEELSGVIEVDTPEPVLAHLGSYRAWADQAGVPFEAALEQAARDLEERLRRGPFTVTTRQGLVIADR
ncbi:class I SAM-dependent methyltransferase [Nocardiopsis sp. CNT312]|uniref:class I SAM-dependent methyltransferase n=1 Tax=Nocardiopsis sp. CNT312 TaxID=1137268 RepID=UPI0004AEEDD7|nr:class I SAM-dependent methyltransferase [Nocardiopsis sp. CNT312]